MASTVEPDTAPPADTYFPLVLGPTILEPGSTRYYSLRYEFKPASIDTGSPGTLHKGAENKVTVEFSNNQAGKPKVAFQGNSEDAKDCDAVIFFDGTCFRLERLHRAVKSLRHLRQGETAAALAGSGGGGGSGAVSPIHSNGGHANAEKNNQFKAHHITETITDEAPVAPKPEAAPAPAPAKKPTKRKVGSSKAAANKKHSPVNVVKEASPEIEIDEIEMPDPEPDIEPEPEPKRAKPSTPVTAAPPAAAAPVEEVDILGEDDELEVLEEHSDYEIEDVDVSEDEEAEKAGANDPAATLRAQAAAAEAAGSSESGSSSSDSGSGSSSSESGSDDEDSASSGDDI